uniref:Uncharacterized protein MANES_06G054100 n=1 Tax=Rhizophora mucronata TaxID=61149 RepID=A0A2P2ITI1_RHIMU
MKHVNQCSQHHLSLGHEISLLHAKRTGLEN